MQRRDCLAFPTLADGLQGSARIGKKIGRHGNGTQSLAKRPQNKTVVNEDTKTETEHSGFTKMQGKVSEGELSNTSAIVEVRNEQDDTVPGCKESQNPILTEEKLAPAHQERCDKPRSNSI